ncbi:MAG: hypothetical protein Q4D71_15305, partial [Oscillospiraceae bacterium]|nr:hypothetical protein [Oscillospiraceae bacterium]
MSVFGHDEGEYEEHLTIREKDTIYKNIYKSEGGDNASPYARLKAAMDYWCALWFWPIDQAELLPSRSEFFNDLNMVLVGTVNTTVGYGKRKQDRTSIGYDQLTLFDDENEELQLIHKIN